MPSVTGRPSLPARTSFAFVELFIGTVHEGDVCLKVLPGPFWHAVPSLHCVHHQNVFHRLAPLILFCTHFRCLQA